MAFASAMPLILSDFSFLDHQIDLSVLLEHRVLLLLHPLPHLESVETKTTEVPELPWR